MNIPFAADSKLVEACRRGDEKAYQVLYRKYSCKLYKYTRQYMDGPVSEEIVMDVMLNIWQKKHLLKGDQPLFAYLLKCVKNRIIDHWRMQRIKTVSLEYAYTDLNSSLKADSPLLHKELEGIYRNGLEQLPPKKKLIFRMSREEGISYQEIANQLQISKNTVENHMVTAIRLLRAHVRAAV